MSNSHQPHPEKAPASLRRRQKLSDLRARFAIKQHEANQLSSAIDVLVDNNTDDEKALSIADKIVNAPIGL